MSETEAELKEMVRSCLRGDWDARVRFQHLFGEDIYKYPMTVFRVPKDKAADFYVYAFENDRIFRRLAGFEGRNRAHFKTYLGRYILHDLFMEWQRSRNEPDTVSLETPVQGSASGERVKTLQELIGDPKNSIETLNESPDETAPVKNVFAGLDAEKKLILKILHIGEFDLSPQEIRFLCKKSGRTYREVVTLVEETRAVLSRKDEKMAFLQDQLESVFGWILLYQKELAKIEQTLNFLTAGSSKYNELSREKEELERKLAWRYRQQQQVLEKTRQFRITTPYKDIARLLNVPLGTVCSLVGRIREEILEAFGSPGVSGKAATP